MEAAVKVARKRLGVLGLMEGSPAALNGAVSATASVEKIADAIERSGMLS